MMARTRVNTTVLVPESGYDKTLLFTGFCSRHYLSSSAVALLPLRAPPCVSLGRCCCCCCCGGVNSSSLTPSPLRRRGRRILRSQEIDGFKWNIIL